MIEEKELFYILTYTNSLRNTIIVVDVKRTKSDEMLQYYLVNEDKFDTASDAISYAKKLAIKYHLQYKPFSPLYGNYNERDEYIYL